LKAREKTYIYIYELKLIVRFGLSLVFRVVF
jgi:hypothetical protein